jgi:hypothetical protein
MMVHVENDLVNVVLSDDATDLSSAITLLNEEKTAFNAHRVQLSVHVRNDTIDIVTSPDATDLASAAILAAELVAEYELHRVSPGVHGSSVFIRLDPPNRVLYTQMKFFKTSVGVPGLVAPFAETHLIGLMDDSGVETDFFYYW